MSNLSNDNENMRKDHVVRLLQKLDRGHNEFPKEAYPLHRIADALGMMHFEAHRVPIQIYRQKHAVVKKLRSALRRIAKTRNINEKEKFDGATWTPLGTYVRHKKGIYADFDPGTYATFLDLGASLRARSGGTTVKEMLRSGLNDWERQWFEKRGIRFKPRSYLTSWTTPGYKNVQSHRRQGTFPSLKSETERINRYVAQFMRNSALRTPQMPAGMEKRPTYLWRGMCENGVLKMESRRVIKDRGFVAFSIDKEVADRFAKQMKLKNYSFFPERFCPPGADYMLRLKVSSLPPGIPWIWFSAKKQRSPDWSSSDIHEAEVLFPPGRLTIVRRTGRTLDVEYAPDPRSTSFTGKHIVRQPGIKKQKRKRI
jgi:hypothetical protein